MPLNIDQDLIAKAPGGITPGGMGMSGGGMSGQGGAEIMGLLKGLMGQRGIAPAGPNGAVSPTGEQLIGPPVQGAGQYQGGLLSGLSNQVMGSAPVQGAQDFLSRFGRRGP